MYAIFISKVPSLDSKIEINDAAQGTTEIEDDLNPAHNVQDLPARRKTSRKVLQARCRVLLNKIIGLTYLLKDEPSLVKFEGQLQKMFKQTEQLVKSDNGVVLESDEKMRKKRKLTKSSRKGDESTKIKRSKKVAKDDKDCLPKRKYGKPRHPFAKRVGRHAEIMRKQYRVNIPIGRVPTTVSTKVTENTSKNIIDLTSINDSSGTVNASCETIWVPSLGLRKEDESILQNNGTWLNDSIINAAQDLLHRQFPYVNGLVNSLCVASKKSAPCPLTGIGIQIHNSGNMHWLVSTVVNGEITVYDSLKPTIPSALSPQLQHVYGDKSGEPVRVKVYMCQKQNGESDCGLFAIANALALAKGVSLKTVVFSQLQMRSHLHNCLQNELLTMFPHKLIKNNDATELKSFIIS